MKLTEKQENCPYCHAPYKPFISTGIGPANGSNNSLYYETVSNVLGKGPLVGATRGIVNVLDFPNCPFCRRPLNGEDD